MIYYDCFAMQRNDTTIGSDCGQNGRRIVQGTATKGHDYFVSQAHVQQHISHLLDEGRQLERVSEQTSLIYKITLKYSRLEILFVTYLMNLVNEEAWSVCSRWARSGCSCTTTATRATRLCHSVFSTSTCARASSAKATASSCSIAC